jgi:hypothetical protein
MGRRHLSRVKTFQKIARTFYWPKMRTEIFDSADATCVRGRRPPRMRVWGCTLQALFPNPRRDWLLTSWALLLARSGGILPSWWLWMRSPNSYLFSLFGKSRLRWFVTVCRGYFFLLMVRLSVVTDNAKVFRCKQIRDLCFRWGITRITTTPYYPQGSLAERVNRNLKSALKIFHHESQATWDEDLLWLSLAFNTAIHESTQCTPDKLFLGRELKSPLVVRWDLTPV